MDKSRQCTICAHELDPTHFSSSIPSDRCHHLVRVCKRCVERHVAAEIAKGRPESISCLECSSVLSYEEVRGIVSIALFDRYDLTITKALYESTPGFTWCTRPGCGFGQICDQDDQIMICGHCDFKSCILCREPWHTEQTCSYFQQQRSHQDDPEAATLRLVADISKSCPGCQRLIERDGGCSHMTCSRCDHQFCWDCLAPYSGRNGIWIRGNDAHDHLCRFFPSSDETMPSARLSSPASLDRVTPPARIAAPARHPGPEHTSDNPFTPPLHNSRLETPQRQHKHKRFRLPSFPSSDENIPSARLSSLDRVSPTARMGPEHTPDNPFTPPLHNSRSEASRRPRKYRLPSRRARPLPSRSALKNAHSVSTAPPTRPRLEPLGSRDDPIFV